MAAARLPRLLLLDEPTRGVDVGARAELYQVIRRLADAGVGVLLVSSEVPEVLGLADRVLVMREGRVVHEAGGRELDETPCSTSSWREVPHERGRRDGPARGRGGSHARRRERPPQDTEQRARLELGRAVAGEP